MYVETVINAIVNAASTITVTWSAVPLTEYCVNINKTTLNSSETIILDPVCTNTNHFNLTYLDHSVCDRFSFTVTPTDGGRRGTTSEPETGFFTISGGKCSCVCFIVNLHSTYLVVYRTSIPVHRSTHM